MTCDDLASLARDPERYCQSIASQDWQGAFDELDDGDMREFSPRLHFVLRYRGQLPDDAYGAMVLSAYKRAFKGISDIPRNELRALLCDPRAAKSGGVTDNLSKVAHLPDPLLVFRGFHKSGGEDGFSWTTDEGNAAHFALVWHETKSVPRIARGNLKKANILALFSNESELVADPRDVALDAIYKVPEKYWAPNGYSEEYRARVGRLPTSA